MTVINHSNSNNILRTILKAFNYGHYLVVLLSSKSIKRYFCSPMKIFPYSNEEWKWLKMLWKRITKLMYDNMNVHSIEIPWKIKKSESVRCTAMCCFVAVDWVWSHLFFFSFTFLRKVGIVLSNKKHTADMTKIVRFKN